MVLINEKWCKKCNICVEMCPKNALGVNNEGNVFLADSDGCSHCSFCEWICPDFAIQVINEKQG